MEDVVWATLFPSLPRELVTLVVDHVPVGCEGRLVRHDILYTRAHVSVAAAVCPVSKNLYVLTWEDNMWIRNKEDQLVAQYTMCASIQATDMAICPVTADIYVLNRTFRGCVYVFAAADLMEKARYWEMPYICEVHSIAVSQNGKHVFVAVNQSKPKYGQEKRQNKVLVFTPRGRLQLSCDLTCGHTFPMQLERWPFDKDSVVILDIYDGGSLAIMNGRGKQTTPTLRLSPPLYWNMRFTVTDCGDVCVVGRPAYEAPNECLYLYRKHELLSGQRARKPVPPTVLSMALHPETPKVIRWLPNGTLYVCVEGQSEYVFA